MIVVPVLLCVVAIVFANLRWLRVAQREHYLAGSVSRFVLRWWWHSRSINRALVIVAAVGIALGLVLKGAALLAAGVAIVGPVGLGAQGRTSKLAFTRRLKTLTVVTAVVQALIITVGAILGEAVFVAALLAIVAPTVIDLCLAALAPWERRNVQPFVQSATKRLRSIDPTVVAITGSYGKTTTKNYAAHLLGARYSVFATPSSFNNRAGLSRAINEQLTPGTDVFIAEMGTYGPGEIAELCNFCRPTISVLTSIGPVHLERFGSEEAIVVAKAEIFAEAEVCILNIDDERLAALADDLESKGKRVWRCSAVDTSADVCVYTLGAKAVLYLNGEVAGEVEVSAPPTNVACAIAVARELDVPVESLLARLGDLPVVAHRQQVTKSASGVVVIDDTYNANPASVRRSINLLAETGESSARRVVVTPGIVELGKRQQIENFAFGREVGDQATDLVIVGRTNRKALLDGARTAGIKVVVVDKLPEAVDWVKNNLGDGDAVAYVNDLPDHFP